MLAIPQLSILSFPIINTPSLSKIIGTKVETAMFDALEDYKILEKGLYQTAYIQKEPVTDEEMQSLEIMEEMLFIVSDSLEKTVEKDVEKTSKLYKCFDEMYTLSLKITTEISYISSKHRQLSNVA